MNWQNIITDLCDRMSYSQIARITKASNRQTIMNIKSGVTKEPRYSLGVNILALHERLFNV